MKIAALLIAVLVLAWPLRAEAPPPDLRLGHDEVRIDLSDPANLRTILNQLAINEGHKGPLWWRAPTEAETEVAATLCPPDKKRPIAVIGVITFCAMSAETLRNDLVFTRNICTTFDRRYAGFPDPVKPFMLVCRKPVI